MGDQLDTALLSGEVVQGVFAMFVFLSFVALCVRWAKAAGKAV